MTGSITKGANTVPILDVKAAALGGGESFQPVATRYGNFLVKYQKSLLYVYVTV